MRMKFSFYKMECKAWFNEKLKSRVSFDKVG